jgi:nucleotide-binding universal stress UspA family protein
VSLSKQSIVHDGGVPNGFELGNDGPTVILVGVDGTETSNRAGSYAAGLARRQHARLVSVYVRPTAALASLSAGASMAMSETIDEVAAELATAVAQARDRLGIDVSLVVKSGDPAHEIARVADEIRADAVVVGASSNAGHRFVGSIGVRLVKAGRWPVTVVP